ncbi:MAG: endonuclease [Bacteroidota bacterium]|nr:endonuclease [Bacteroidota bacterium]
MRHIVLVLLILFSIVSRCYSQANKLSDEFTFMFYNTENFFDCENDSLTQDDEFTPDGDRRWNYSRFYDKADRLAKVILAAGKWNAPIVVGLCEVESMQALEVLVKQTPLNKFNYKIVHKDSPDERGIDVAFIYRSELFKPFDYKAIPLIDPLDPEFKSRDILRVSGILNNGDTIHVFLNHWPSRYGGIMETVRLRGLAAKTLKKSIQELLTDYPKAKIICMGDFNDTPEDESLSRILIAVKSDNPEVKGEMVNLSFGWMTRPVQTLKNMYSWQVFDQLIVSDYFLESGSFMKSIKAEIFDAPFLLEPDKKYGGVKPKRTYVGFKYQDGFSDHLPVLLKFQLLNH